MDNCLVSIVMGSDSDLPVMMAAANVLSEFQVPYEVVISSAHRTPHQTAELAAKAESRGVAVIIAGAGGAAHLPGVIAALTLLPVIGVPIQTAALGGVDSLYAIVQMPGGIPVATVGINGAQNAALLAVQILAVKHPDLRERLRVYRKQMAEKVEAKAARLREMGPEAYLAGSGKSGKQ
jgi:5-(carboxyamino)imidazole ribonucleotide mutase